MPNYLDPSPLGDSLSQRRTATVTPADLPLSSAPHNTSIALTPDAPADPPPLHVSVQKKVVWEAPLRSGLEI